MKSMNVVLLSGTVACVPEYMERSSLHITTVTLNTVATKKSNQSQSYEEVIEPVQVKFFGAKADSVFSSCQGGEMMVIQGRVLCREVQTKAGGTFVSTEIIGDSFDIMKSSYGGFDPNTPMADDEVAF